MRSGDQHGLGLGFSRLQWARYRYRYRYRYRERKPGKEMKNIVRLSRIS